MRAWIAGVESLKASRVLQPWPGRSIMITRWLRLSASPSGWRIDSRFELAPWIKTTGSDDAFCGPVSTTCKRPPVTSIIRPAGACERSIRNTPTCVIAASTISATATVIKLIRIFRNVLRTSEVRVSRVRVS